jgi:hypothetical protein
VRTARRAFWPTASGEAIDEKVPKEKYPNVTKRVGKSPPLYMGEKD